MRTTREVLDFVEEQIWFTEQQMKDEGVKPPLLSKIKMQPTQDSLEQKYWLYQTIKWFIQGEL